MKLMTFAAAIAISVLAATGAQAACMTKGAIATSATEASAKWFAMETMVQAVSWAKWPGWVATGQIDGYRVASQSYKCRPDAGGTTCTAKATFCATSK